MYRVYMELTNSKGEIVHKTPLVRCATLSLAMMHARLGCNGVHQMGIYKIHSDGSEERVR